LIDAPGGVTGGSGPTPASAGASPAPASGSSSAQAPAGALSSAEGSGGVSDGSNPEESNPLYPRFKAVNESYSKLKWAEGIDSERAQRALAVAEWIDQNPRGFYDYFGSQLRSNGMVPAETVQAAARSEGVNGNGLPGPDFIDPGTGAKFYSADRLGQVLEQFEERISERMAPVEQQLGTMAVQVRARADAQAILARAEKWPGFSEFRGQLFNAMRSNPRLGLEQAYIDIVVPQLGARERQAFATELQQKPGATTVNPGGLAPAAGEKTSNLPIRTLLAREMRARGILKSK
jgi:hypothetical protein